MRLYTVSVTRRHLFLSSPSLSLSSHLALVDRGPISISTSRLTIENAFSFFHDERVRREREILAPLPKKIRPPGERTRTREANDEVPNVN